MTFLLLKAYLEMVFQKIPNQSNKQTLVIKFAKLLLRRKKMVISVLIQMLLIFLRIYSKLVLL